MNYTPYAFPLPRERVRVRVKYFKLPFDKRNSFIHSGNMKFFKPTKGRVILAVLFLFLAYFLETLLLWGCMPLVGSGLPNLENPSAPLPPPIYSRPCGFVSDLFILAPSFVPVNEHGFLFVVYIVFF